MNLLVTAGNTTAPIDRVRCITNVFTGRTGTAIALHAHRRGHTVTLLTSHPEVVAKLDGPTGTRAQGWSVRTYRTFEELERCMAELITARTLDAVVNCAAVNDYRVDGVYAPADGTRFLREPPTWQGPPGAPPALADVSAGKVKSDERELWLRLVRTPKLIDRMRSDWAFGGVLVKFKLEVDLTDEDLRRIAERSRRQSAADLVVANTLEGKDSWALLGPVDERYQHIPRAELPARLLDAVERLHRGRHG